MDGGWYTVDIINIPLFKGLCSVNNASASQTFNWTKLGTRNQIVNSFCSDHLLFEFLIYELC